MHKSSVMVRLQLVVVICFQFDSERSLYTTDHAKALCCKGFSLILCKKNLLANWLIFMIQVPDFSS